MAAKVKNEIQRLPLPIGFTVYGVCCGIKQSGKLDLGLIESHSPSNTFGAFTQNDIQAPPIIFCKEQINKDPVISHVLVNSGVANACTGSKGMQNIETIKKSMDKFGRVTHGFLMCSTGVIGQQLPVKKIQLGLEMLNKSSDDSSPEKFSRSIMTTDTVPKTGSRVLKLGSRTITLSGFSKGAGMINPNMATMLAYILTDISLPKSYSRKFRGFVEESFNSISVDGDMSTNDTVLLMSSEAQKLNYQNLTPIQKKKFDTACLGLFQELAQKIVRDGEGATKLIQIHIKGAKNSDNAKNLACAVANSPLVKTAFFGNDPNWGRIIASLGSKGLGIEENLIKIKLGNTTVFSGGSPRAFNAHALSSQLKKNEVSLEIDLNQGNACRTYWTCDLSYDYIKINAEYHT